VGKLSTLEQCQCQIDVVGKAFEGERERHALSVSLFTTACLDMSRASVGDPDLLDPSVRKTKLFPSHTEQL